MPARRIRLALCALCALTAAALLGAGGPRALAAPVAPASAVGYDVAAPQCDAALPATHAFAVVGVNGGLANAPNPCLAAELSWALSSPGLRAPAQPPVSLYVNTADPGPAHGVRDWPRSGATPHLGRCHGRWSAPCAYLYGQARAKASFATARILNPGLASTATWWLDVETSSSWAPPGRGALNLAALHGFVDGLRASGARHPIGVYSFALDWRRITGLSGRRSAAGFGSPAPPAWVGGTRPRSRAAAVCDSPAFTGIRPRLVQFRAGRFDGDLRCADGRRRGSA